MLYSYPSLHLTSILLSGCVIAVAAVFLSSITLVFLLFCGFASFLLVTFLCFHPHGNSWRSLVTHFLIVPATAYSTPTQPRDRRRLTSTVKGPVSTLVHNESQKIVQLIVRDFVISWYRNVSRDKELPIDVVRLLQHLALELYFRLQRVDLEEIILHILPLINPFLLTLNQVGHASPGVYDVNHPYCVILFEKNPRLTHPALKSSTSELQYLQKIVDSFLLSSVPQQYMKCDIALQVIRDVLVHKLFKAIIDLLCDPNFLIECIPLILAKISEDRVKQVMSAIEAENDRLTEELDKEDGLLSSISADQFQRIGNPTSIWEQYDFAREVDSQPLLDTLQPPDQLLVQSVSAASEELVLVSFPPVYISRHVSVDTKDGIHVGYIIKFPSNMLSPEDLRILRTSEETELECLKRFSEFVKFHKMLLKSDIGPRVKGNNLPDRKIISNLWSKVSSSDPDPAIVLERKEGLDKYIQEISNVPEVRNSQEFKNFLVSGVSVLQEANIVSKAAKQPRRKTLVDWRKSHQLSDDKPRDIGSVLDAFLDMQVLLPCHSLLSSSSPDDPVSRRHTSVVNPPVAHQPNNGPPVSHHTRARLLANTLSDLVLVDYTKDKELSSRCKEKAPLFSCLMSLVNEVTGTIVPELWLTHCHSQLAIVSLLGQFVDRFLWEELKTVVYDDTRWARMLYNLRHTLWPGGELNVNKRRSLREEEKRALREEAVVEIRQFLPNFLPYLIGKENYMKTIHHCLDTIQNPKINRHFVYHLLDLAFARVVPEFYDPHFQKKLMKLRSRPLFMSRK